MTNRTDQPIQFDSVADIYDDYVRADFDLPFWLSEARRAKGKVLELTCGTGRVSIPLLKSGIDLTCVDYAPQMLFRFRKKLEDNHLTCRVICQDIADLKLPDRYGLIIVPFHSFSEILSEERRRLALERIRDHLTEDGLFICTLQNPTVRTSSMDGAIRLVGEFPMHDNEQLIVRSSLSFDASSQLAHGTQFYERRNSAGKIIERRTLEIRFYLYYRHHFQDLVRDIGFEVVDLYGDYNSTSYDERSSPYMIWKLRVASG